MQLSAEDFSAHILPFALPSNVRLAIAVSGGPDSMALAFLVKRWCEQNNHPAPLAFIVDHGLRDESAAEAAMVKQRLQDIGIVAEILRWEHAPIASRLHAEARKARYQLLLAACHKHSIKHLLFAHQREDQAETILMRFAKGTGLDGLAGIYKESRLDDIKILRPLLDVPKDKLIALCDAQKIPYVTDPSNKLEKFARGRLRRVMPLLAEEGLTVDRLVDFGIRAAEARDALEHYTQEFLRLSSQQDEWGVIAINKEKLLQLPRAIALRAISHALQAVHAEDYAPQHAALSHLLDAVNSDVEFSARTLNGCLVSERQKSIIVAREPSAVTEVIPIHAGETVIWDGRWRVSLASAAKPETYQVRALGTQSEEVLDRFAPNLRHKVPQGRVRATLPALWLGGEISTIPFFSENAHIRAELLSIWPPHPAN